LSRPSLTGDIPKGRVPLRDLIPPALEREFDVNACLLPPEDPQGEWATFPTVGSGERVYLRFGIWWVDLKGRTAQDFVDLIGAAIFIARARAVERMQMPTVSWPQRAR
jgi:hypothetical protein